MALPFINSVARYMPGFGSGSFYGSATQNVTGSMISIITIADTSTIPSGEGTPFNRNGGPPPSSGKWHLRISNATVTSTNVAIEVQVSDGTNNWVVATPVGIVDDSAPIYLPLKSKYLDIEGEFLTDISIKSVRFRIATDDTSQVFPTDVEVSLV